MRQLYEAITEKRYWHSNNGKTYILIYQQDDPSTYLGYDDIFGRYGQFALIPYNAGNRNPYKVLNPRTNKDLIKIIKGFYGGKKVETIRFVASHERHYSEVVLGELQKDGVTLTVWEIDTKVLPEVDDIKESPIGQECFVNPTSAPFGWVSMDEKYVWNVFKKYKMKK